MDLQRKIQDAVDQYNRVNQSILETEARLQELKDTREQIRGRVVAYQEIQREEAPNGAVPEDQAMPAVADKSEDE